MLTSKRFWFGLVITGAFLAFFLYNAPLGRMVRELGRANVALAFASVPLYFLGFWIRTLRWQVLLRPVERIPARRLYPVVLIGLMANNIMPARIGEVVRAYLVGEREGVSKSSALGTIAVDRTFDGLTLVAFLGVATAIAGTSAGVRTVGIGTALVFFGATAVLAALAFSPNHARRIVLTFLNRLPHGLEEKVEGLLDSFLVGVQSIRSPSIMLIATGLSFVSWCTETSMYWVVGQAFNLDVGIEVYFLIVAAANLALSIFASPGGIGPFEAATKVILLAFLQNEDPKGLAEAYAVGLHALLLGPVILVGLALLWFSRTSLSDILGIRKSAGGEPEPPSEPPGVLAKPSAAVE